MVANPISKSSIEWLGPSADCVEITPHATDEFKPSRGIRVNAAGDVTMRFEASAADVTLSLDAGHDYPYSVKAVRITGTTATGIHVLY